MKMYFKTVYTKRTIKKDFYHKLRFCVFWDVFGFKFSYTVLLFLMSVFLVQRRLLEELFFSSFRNLFLRRKQVLIFCSEVEERRNLLVEKTLFEQRQPSVSTEIKKSLKSDLLLRDWDCLVFSKQLITESVFNQFQMMKEKLFLAIWIEGVVKK